MQISGENKIGIGLSLSSAAGTGGVIVAPTPLVVLIGWVLLIGGVGGLIVLAIHHFYPTLKEIHYKRRNRVIPLFGIIVSFIALLLFSGWYFWPVKSAPSSPMAQVIYQAAPIVSSTETWLWPALTDEQISQISSSLGPAPTEPIMVVDVTSAGKPLAASLARVFGQAHWQSLARPSLPPEYSAIGIRVYPENDFTRRLKSAIEKVTGFNVDFGPVPSPGTQSLYILIGAKPLSEPLPDNLLKEAKEIGTNMVLLSNDISAFIRERNQIKSQRYAERSPKDQWLFNRDFEGETSTVFNNRFGAIFAEILRRADFLGVLMPRQIAQVDYFVAAGQAWLSSVGDRLQQGKLSEARSAAANDRLFRR